MNYRSGRTYLNNFPTCELGKSEKLSNPVKSSNKHEVILIVKLLDSSYFRKSYFRKLYFRKSYTC